MGSQANLTINDGAAVPVARTFYTNGAGWSDSAQAIVANWTDRSPGYAIGYWKASLSFKEPSRNKKNYTVMIKTSVPVLEVLNSSTYSGITPAPTVSYMPISTTKFDMPERSSSDSRKNQLAIHRNMLANAVVTSAIHDLEPTT